MTHHLLAAWSLGASPKMLNEIFNKHASYQLPKPKPPEAISGMFPVARRILSLTWIVCVPNADENWKKHLGHDK